MASRGRPILTVLCLSDEEGPVLGFLEDTAVLIVTAKTGDCETGVQQKRVDHQAGHMVGVVGDFHDDRVVS